MKKGGIHRSSATTPLGCFGGFQSDDPVCRKYCAIRIRCAIERDQAIFLEVLDEPAAGDDQLLTFQ
ncbi:MAG: hypothetical protein MUC57_05935 [Desulfobacterales bacterium]|jgi:hypothetical protein|nr:hypothetical protein [Desulfobacterales bacterium]